MGGDIRLVSERGIKDSFQKVKADIASVYKSLEKTQKELRSGFADKKEFNDFIQALDDRLEEIEASIIEKEEELSKKDNEQDNQLVLMVEKLEEVKADLARVIDELKSWKEQVEKLTEAASNIPDMESRIESISLDLDGNKKAEKEFSKQVERLNAQILSSSKDITAVKSRLAEVPDYSRLLKRIEGVQDGLLDTKKLVKEADISELKLELHELTRDFSKLGSRFVSWGDLSKSGKKTENELNALNNRISSLISSLDERKFAGKDEVERISVEINSIKSSVNDILKSEVDLDEYARKSEISDLEKKQRETVARTGKDNEARTSSMVTDIKDRVKNVESQLKDLGNNLDILSTRTERAVSELSGKKEVSSSDRELKRLRDDVDYIKANLVTKGDVDQALSAVYAEHESKAEKKFEPEQNEGFKNERFNIGPYITALIVIILVVLAGYYIYEQMQQPVSAVNVTKQPSVIQASMRSNVSGNLTPEQILLDNQEKCLLNYECNNNSDGTFNFDCYYDEQSGLCRCYKGGLERCDEQRMQFLQSLRENVTGQPPVTEPVGSNRYLLYAIAGGSIIAFIILLVYLFRKGEEAVMEDEQNIAPKPGQEAEDKKIRRKKALK